LFADGGASSSVVRIRTSSPSSSDPEVSALFLAAALTLPNCMYVACCDASLRRRENVPRVASRIPKATVTRTRRIASTSTIGESAAFVLDLLEAARVGAGVVGARVGEVGARVGARVGVVGARVGEVGALVAEVGEAEPHVNWGVHCDLPNPVQLAPCPHEAFQQSNRVWQLVTHVRHAVIEKIC
jgi:hypothetical protein